jgi:hypothetical protein
MITQYDVCLKGRQEDKIGRRLNGEGHKLLKIRKKYFTTY